MKRPITLVIPTVSPSGTRRTQAIIAAANSGTRPPDRVFVVNNGGQFSGEGRGVEVFTPGTNIGVGAAFNEALRRFEDWIIFANDDIGLANDSIERIVAAAESSDAPLICSPGHPFCFFLHKKEAVRLIGYFDEGFAPAYYEDTDYLKRMYRAGTDIATVVTGVTHQEQSTARDMGWNAHAMMQQQLARYVAKWGGGPGGERFEVPWGCGIEVIVPSRRSSGIQRLLDSLAWQTVRPELVTIVSNDRLLQIDTHGLRVRQLFFRSEHEGIGEGDVSLRRNVGTYAANHPYIVYSDDDQMWPQGAIEEFAKMFAGGKRFIVGHHRFVEMGADNRRLRNAPATAGDAREAPINSTHMWQSCYGGCLGMTRELIFSLGGWDTAYPRGEDQQLAQRFVGAGTASTIFVHEPPWAWHPNDGSPTDAYDESAVTNVCPPGTHDHFTDGPAVRCRKCPILRHAQDWGVVGVPYQPERVQVEEKWH